MKNTTHYNLKKPESADYYNIDDQNTNMDIIDTEISNKVDKIDGKGLSTEDFTTVEKNKLAQIYDWATGLFSLKSHNHDTVYEKIITKKSGFNLEKSDSVSSSSSQILATLNAVKTAYDKAVSAHNLASSKLGLTAKAADSDKLDGKDSTAFAPSGHNHDSRYEQIISKKSGFNLDKSDSVTSTSTSILATVKAVKTAYDKAISAYNLASSKLGATAKAVDSDKLDGKNSTAFAASGHNHDSRYERIISKKSGFNLDKSDSVTSTSTSILATVKAVKIAYDKAVQALNTANSKLSANATAINSNKYKNREDLFHPDNYGFEGHITTNFNLTNGNANQVITANSNSAIQVGISKGIRANAQIVIIRVEEGDVNIAPLTGVVLHSVDNMRKIADKFGMVALYHKGGNVWYLSGSLE